MRRTINSEEAVIDKKEKSWKTKIMMRVLSVPSSEMRAH
jgi:hypothetical protein